MFFMSEHLLQKSGTSWSQVIPYIHYLTRDFSTYISGDHNFFFDNNSRTKEKLKLDKWKYSFDGHVFVHFNFLLMYQTPQTQRVGKTD